MGKNHRNMRKKKKKCSVQPDPKVVYTDNMEWLDEDKIEYPTYETLESRMKTFAKYPDKCKERREAFAKAGFFYTGTADWVVCCRCALGLKNWDDKEDPVLIHAMFYPFCLYGKGSPEYELIDYDFVPTSAEPITAEEMEDMTVDKSAPEFQCNRYNCLKEENF